VVRIEAARLRRALEPVVLVRSADGEHGLLWALLEFAVLITSPVGAGTAIVQPSWR
jgi:hypothetical protein